MKAFIVDDAAIVVEVLTRALADLDGIELCGQTGRVRDALVMIAQRQPDLVILDVHLEDGSGLDVLRHLRQQSSRPVIVMFSNDALMRAAVLDAGADYFFDKSIEFQPMLATLKTLQSEFQRS